MNIDLNHKNRFYRLDYNLMVKVSDFGLTKDVDKRDYYRVETKSKPLPIRWMSLEAIQCGFFSSKSDVVCMHH